MAGNPVNGFPFSSRKDVLFALILFGLFLWMGLGVVSVNPQALGAVLLSLWILLALGGWGLFWAWKTPQAVFSREEEKKRSAADSEKTEEKEGLLEVLWRSIREGILVLNNADRVERMNPAAQEILGVKEEEALGRHALEIVRDARWIDLLDDSKKQAKSMRGEMEWRGDHERFFEVTVIPLFSREEEGKKRIGTAVIWEDVTEQRRWLNQRAEFAANVSHELKTPLSSLLAAVETFQDAEPQDPKVRKRFIQIIQQQAFRLRRLIQDVLDLSQVETGAWPEKLKAVDVEESLRTVLESFEPTVREKNIRFKLSFSSSKKVWAFPRGLQQVWINLLDNALRYSPAGGEIEIDAKDREGSLRVHVRDRGPGIAEEHLPRIFERFYRVDPSRSREEGGTGLGLSVVKHLVEKMGGRVGVESRLGEGSVFWVELNTVEEEEK